MRKLLLFLIVFCSTQLQASHIISGNFTYEYVSTSGSQLTYKVTLTLLRDVTGISMPTSATVYYKKSNQTTASTSAVLTQVSGTGSTQSSYCNSSVGYQLFEYSSNIILDAGSAYDIAYSTCCRGPGIDNIANPSSQGIYISTKVVTSRPTVRAYNNSVTFNNLINSAPINVQVPFEIANADPDGDSLSFQITATKSGAAATLSPTNIGYSTGYSNTQPFGASGSVFLDTANRILVVESSILQNCIVTVKVVEWAKDTSNVYKIMGVCEKEILFNFNAPSISITQRIEATVAAGDFGSDTVVFSTSDPVFPYSGNFDSAQVVLTNPNGDTTDYAISAAPASGSYQDFIMRTSAFLTPGSWTLYFAVNSDSMSIVGSCGAPLIDTITFFVIPPIIQISGPKDSVYGSGPNMYYIQNNTYLDSIQWSVQNGAIDATYGTDSIQLSWGNSGNGPATLMAIGWTYGYSDTAAISLSIYGIGIDEPTLIRSFYPNPACNVLNIITTASAMDVQFNILDLSGREVLKGHLQTGKIDVSSLANGSYLLNIQSTQNSAIQRFSIQR